MGENSVAEDTLVSQLKKDTEYGLINRQHSSTRQYQPKLFTNSNELQLGKELKNLLTGEWDSYFFSVAFISSSGIAALKGALMNSQARGTIVTSTYLDFNEPEDLLELSKLKNCKVYLSNIKSFHSKGYIFNSQDLTAAIIGSSNLTQNAWSSNAEWNFKIVSKNDGDLAHQLSAAIDEQIDNSESLTPEIIEQYEQRRRPTILSTPGVESHRDAERSGEIKPNAMQKDALVALHELYESKEKRGLIVSATGTGKTILAALAVKEFKPGRMLFLVHSETILNKAMEEFKKVFATDSKALDY